HATSELQGRSLYALLSSRLVFWLWRVEGDAFHVSRGWINSIPIPDSRDWERTLSHLADLLWRRVKSARVTSTNTGRRTLSHSPSSAPEVVDAIDAALCDAYGLAHAFEQRLKQFVWDNTMPGRLEGKTPGGRRALKAWNK